jgi:hypothetical protein
LLRFHAPSVASPTIIGPVFRPLIVLRIRDFVFATPNKGCDVQMKTTQQSVLGAVVMSARPTDVAGLMNQISAKSIAKYLQSWDASYWLEASNSISLQKTILSK